MADFGADKFVYFAQLRPGKQPERNIPTHKSIIKNSFQSPLGEMLGPAHRLMDQDEWNITLSCRAINLNLAANATFHESYDVKQKLVGYMADGFGPHPAANCRHPAGRPPTKNVHRQR